MENDGLNLLDQAIEFGKAIDSTLKWTKSSFDLVEKVRTTFGKPKLASKEEVEAQLISLANDIEKAQLTNKVLKHQSIILQQSVRDLLAQKEKLDRYELCETPGGYTVYQLKDEYTAEQPHHYACPICYENAKISILQGEPSLKRCFACESKPYFHIARARSPITVV